ncbi:MAG: hypothetical protein QGI21_06340 [Candidatus Poseidoniaceae archaeon]|nr:hypothetical protein [Candidatus Poseidoniaceae archaeon]
MSKLTPMILALLMLASTSLVALDWAELENEKMNDADGRTGPNAEVVSIINPRPTTADDITGELRNTLKAGEDVNFEVFISNSGDTAIDEMAVTVSIYLAESGNRGNLAMDAAGNELSWTNGDVICDDTMACPWAALAPGDNLANGKYTPVYQGSPITWTPITGDYMVVITADAYGDNDPGNDYQEVMVSVTDWQDVVVDLAWDSGKETEGGPGSKAFTLTVSTDGSTDWEARSIVVSLEVTGTLSNATNDAGEDLMGVTSVGGLGTLTMSETFQHEVEVNNTTSDNRYVMTLDDTATYAGYVTPDTSSQSGTYKIEASLVSYVRYGQIPDCMETETRNQTEGAEETEITYLHFCEVEFGQDDDAGTSEDEIDGMVKNMHDIGITDLVINQGYASDGDGNPMGAPDMAGMTSGPLNPSWGSVQASVRHMGSDLETTYDWKVSFTIENIATGVTTMDEADSCMGGNGEDYMHANLGMDFDTPGVMEFGEACVYFDFVPGIYNIEAVVSMENIPNGTDENGADTGLPAYSDDSSRNDDANMYEIVALNNRPDVTLTLETEGDITVAGEKMITLAASAVDADDATGTTLTYSWTHPGLEMGQNSECDGMGPAFSVCNLNPIDSVWATNQMYSVTVTDLHASYSTDYTEVMVWNHMAASHNADSGIEMVYDLTYNSNNDYTVSIIDSQDTYSKDLASFGYSGVYESVWVLDFVPSTMYLADNVLTQSFVINYDTAVVTDAVTSVFYVNQGAWAQLDATLSTAGSTGTIAVAFPADTQTLPAGTIVLMGGDLIEISAPIAHPKDLTMAAVAGGHIDMSWGYEGATVQGIDSLKMTVCADDGSDCKVTTGMNTSQISERLNGQTYTSHGVTYTVTLEVCNVGGCNPTVATGSATADKVVDGDASATEIGISNKDDSAWTVTWTASGDTGDVAGWWVCFADYSWGTPGEMPSDNCVDAGDATSADINKPGADSTKKFYFTAVPYDALGNSKNADVGTDATLVVDNTQVDPCVDNPDSDECKQIGEGTEGDGEVPTWTWGVIIGLVVVAFVVGAFILSRGGDEDEGKDWDY